MSEASIPQHLPHVEASPRGLRSASIQVAQAFVHAWQERHPEGTTDVLFSFDEHGLKGLLGGRRACVVNARGVGPGPDFPREELDHQQSYMTTWLRMIGITDITHIEVEKTLMGVELDQAARSEGCTRAATLGATG